MSFPTLPIEYWRISSNKSRVKNSADSKSNYYKKSFKIICLYLVFGYTVAKDAVDNGVSCGRMLFFEIP